MKAAKTVFELPQALTIDGLADLRIQLLQAMDKGAALELDASAVREIDIAGLQLLCATGKQAERAQLAVTFAGERRGQVIDDALIAAGFARSRACGPCCVCAVASRG